MVSFPSGFRGGGRMAWKDLERLVAADFAHFAKARFKGRIHREDAVCHKPEPALRREGIAAAARMKARPSSGSAFRPA